MENSQGAKLPPFNFLEEFARYNAQKEPITDQVVSLKVVRTVPLETPAPPVPAQIQIPSSTVAPGDLDLAQLAELVKLIFKKAQANAQASISEEDINNVMNYSGVTLIDKVILATYLNKKDNLVV